MAKIHNTDKLNGQFYHKDKGKLDKNISPSPKEHIEVSGADAADEPRLQRQEDLRTASMVCTLSALTIAMTSSDDRSKKVLDELAAKYAAEFGTPSWAIGHIKSLVQKQLQGLPASITKKLHTKPYLIWETGKPLREGAEEDAELLRQAAIKGKFDIYVNDTNYGQLLVLGNQSKLRVGQTCAWETLIALLERVGARWTMQELFERIRPDEVYRRRPHSAHVYQWIRHVKESMKDDISLAGRPNAECVVDSWFQTGERNRVKISPDLKACLIRENPVAGSQW